LPARGAKRKCWRWTSTAALRLTAINAALAEVANVEVQASDVLQGTDGDFDLIVANPPYMADPPDAPTEMAEVHSGPGCRCASSSRHSIGWHPVARYCCTPAWPWSMAVIRFSTPWCHAWIRRDSLDLSRTGSRRVR
jgi:hypothetical protein